MRLNREVELLARVPLFSGLSGEHLELLAFSSERLMFFKGDRILKKGAFGNAAYFITSGSVKRLGVQTIGLPDSYHFDGQLLGETAMLVEVAYDATHYALENTYVLEFTRDSLHKLMRRFPEIGLHLADKLAERLSEMGRLMRALDRDRARRNVERGSSRKIVQPVNLNLTMTGA